MTTYDERGADREIQTVRWGSPTSPAALYGTVLRTEPSGEVSLVNHLMPAGTTLQEWYSFTDYQAVRGTPALPLLHHGRSYRIVPRVESVPADTVLFDVRFFDRFSDLLATTVLYSPTFSFDYPRGCHHYTIRLVNAGCDELRFDSLSLVEVADGRR